MAQLTSGFCSTFGFLCCLFFLPASWEAGANTFHKLQKTGEASTPDHLLTLTPGLTHRAPSAHADLDPGQRPPDLPKSTATQKPKKQCNKVRLAKPVHKPVNNAKAIDYQNTTVHHEMTPALEKNASNQSKDPMIRNGRSADDPKFTNTEKGSEGRHSTSAPRRRTTCKSTTSKSRITRNSGTPSRPVDTSARLRTTSHKPTTPSHDSELHRETTSSSVKSSEAPRTSYRTLRTPATPGEEDHRTPFASDKPVQVTTEHTEHIQETTSASETTRSQATPTQYERETISANERTSSPQVMPIEHDTTLANEKTIQVSVESTEHPEEATSTTQKATKVSESPTVFWRKTTLATKTIKTTGNSEKTVAVLVSTGPPVKATEDKSTALSSHFHKTETTHQGLIDSVTTRMDLGLLTSEAHHLQQNSHSSPGDLHTAGARQERNSFPAWAIVVVILLAVIVLLISVGLICLVACASRTRRVLAQNSEDADFEDGGGRNSYPVYLMEQQNLKPNQIPSPP
ncbi:mucin-like protein 3 [Peromyscus eremicus]|uniref:mucin-like protein 3 n=1 Tax=Peromyscus eremicus TaxID=42410 RepID=UPI0027DBD82B|nr:mucin-like protein 3 [Peromyscus eremicus]